MNSQVKSVVNSTLKFLLAGGLIYWLVSTGKLDLHSASALFRSPLFFLGFLLMAMNLWLTSERWRLLVAPQNVEAKSGEVFRLTLIGVFFNFAMPGGVGGDVIKAYYFGKDHPQARAAAITSVILDRALGLFAMVVMAVFVMASDYERVFQHPTLKALFALLFLLALGFSIAFTALFSRRIKHHGLVDSLLHRLPFSEKLKRLYETAHRFGLERKRILIVLFLSLLAQSVAIVFLWIAGIAAGFEDVPLLTYFLVAPLGFMATAIPISPAGLGVGQAAFLVLFNLYLGHNTNLGPIVMTSQQVMTAIFGLFGVFFYARRKDRVPSESMKKSLEG